MASVLDAAGRPTPAEVIVVGGDWHAAPTDATGRAHLRVAPGAWDVVVFSADLAVVPTSRATVVRAGESASLEFRALPRSARITGTVRLRSDLPTALTSLHVAAYPANPADGAYPVSTGQVAEDRAFSLAVPVGRWRVGLLEAPTVTAPGEAAAGGESRADLEVDFQRLAGVTGFVYEAGLVTERTGPPFSLTSVGLYAIDPQGQHRILAISQARADQTYAVFAPVLPGMPLAAFAWRAGGSAVPAAVRSRAAPGSAAFADFRFVVNSGTLTGRVVDPGGRPVSDAWVATVSAVRYEDWMIWGRPVRAVDGTFHIRVPLGPVLVRAWRDPHRTGAPVRVSVGSPEPVVVRLEAP
ncbi:MAG: carboxypeptidase-like regulatory domain-containing protein [Armatimonadota bacterium]|nr:carboxypeptidase-like regulatory domain-containing protein [Armatimonadota bacterium]